MAKPLTAFGTRVGSFDLAADSLSLSFSPTGLRLEVYATVHAGSVDCVRGFTGWLDVEAGGGMHSRVAWVAPSTGGFVCGRDREEQLQLVAAIDERVVERAERDRLAHGADVTLRFWLSVTAQRSSSVQSHVVVETIPVARSRWGDALETAGFGAAFLHRFPPLALGPRYETVVDSFRAAERSLLHGQHDAAVGSCRAALDRLASIAGLGQMFDKNAAAKLLAPLAVGEVKDNLIGEFLPGLRALLNIGPHPGATSYDAAEARLVVSVTAAFLAYLGERLPK